MIINTFLTFEDFLTQGPKAKEFNEKTKLVLNSIISAPSDDIRFEILTKSSGLTILTCASGSRGKCSFIHNASVLGLKFLGQEEKAVGLIGFEDRAVPVLIRKPQLLETMEDPLAPDLSFLASLKSPDDVIRQMKPDTKTSRKRVSNAILITPWILQAIRKESAVEFGDVFMTVLRAAKAKDTMEDSLASKETEPEPALEPMSEQDDSDEDEFAELTSKPTKLGKNVEIVGDLLQHLYSWSQEAALWAEKGDIGETASLPCFDKDVEKWAKDLTASILTFPSSIQQNNTSSLDASAVRFLGGSINSLTEKMESQLEADKQKKSASSSSKSSKISARKKDLLCHLSSTDGLSPTLDIAQSMKDFLDNPTSAEAYEYLQERLRDRRVANRNPVIGNIYACYSLFFLSKVDEVPGNFTVFAFPRAIIYSSADMNKFHAQSRNGNGMSDERAGELTKQKIFVPEKVEDGKHMLNAFAASAAEFFGDNAMAVSETKSMIDHINLFENKYSDWQRSDPSFMTQVLYAIDQGWERFILSCREGSVDLSLLDISTIKREVERGTFRIRLPHELITLLKKRNMDSVSSSSSSGSQGQGSGNDRKNNKRQRQERGSPVTNQNTNPAWLLKRHESYKEVIHQSILAGVSPPKWNEELDSCAAFHHKGNCHSLCVRIDSHKPTHELSSEQKASHARFITECRASYNARKNA